MQPDLSTASPLRIAYADPPYPGCAHLYADHPDYGGEVEIRVASDRSVAQGQDEPRGWVVRLGHYLRIFGPPASGTLGYRTSDGWIDTLIEQAKEREQEFGGRDV